MKISICAITYNHRDFITQAVESVINQNVGCDLELLVGDDLSTDGTREVLAGLGEKYRDQMRLFLWPDKVGAKENFTRVVDAARGDYIALLDCDDYWTSRLKLQKQVDLLEADRRLSACFHSVVIRHEAGDKPDWTLSPRGAKHRYGLDDFAHIGGEIEASTVLLRRDRFGGFPEWFQDSPAGDWPLFVLFAESGDFGYLDEVMAVKRIHEGSFWNSFRVRRVAEEKAANVMSEMLIRHLGDAKGRPFRKQMYRRYRNIAYWAAEEGDLDEARKYTVKYAKECGFDPAVSYVEPFQMMLRTYLPEVYRLIRGNRRALERHSKA